MIYGYKIYDQGKIQNPEGKPLSGITVNAYDRDFPFGKHSLGSTVSDEKGIFEIQFTESKFRHLFKGEILMYFWKLLIMIEFGL